MSRGDIFVQPQNTLKVRDSVFWSEKKKMKRFARLVKLHVVTVLPFWHESFFLVSRQSTETVIFLYL